MSTPELTPTPTVDRDDETRLGRIALLILYVTVAAAYLTSILDNSWFAVNRELIPLLLVLGVLFVLGYHLGVAYVQRFRHWAAEAVLLLGLVGLAVVIMILGDVQNFWIITLPLVGQAMSFPRPISWALALLSYASVLGVIYAFSGSWEVVVGNALTLGALYLFVMLFSYLTIRSEIQSAEVSRLARELQTANQQLRAYAAQVEELAIAQERNRLAREIHDTLGHYLTVINVQLGAAQAVLDQNPEKAREAIGKAQGLTREGLDDVRRSVASLREASAVENRPVPDAIATLVADSNAAGIHTKLTVHGEPRPLASQRALTLYRAAQESLTNTRKHAHASRIDVELDYRHPDRVMLQVQDNGVGAASTDDGFGLLGIRERVQLLHGTVHVETAPGNGFLLRLSLPTQE